MKRPISLWIFGIGGVIINVFGGAILFLMLYMPLGAFFMVQFLTITALLILLLIASGIALFRLKKWGRNIIIVITIIMNLFIIILLTDLKIFPIVNISVIIFLICFIFYFLKSSTRELFNN